MKGKEKFLKKCKRHPDSVGTVRFPLNGNIFKQASLAPLGINLLEYMNLSLSDQSGSVGTVGFPLTGHLLKISSLRPLGITFIRVFQEQQNLRILEFFYNGYITVSVK